MITRCVRSKGEDGNTRDATDDAPNDGTDVFVRGGHDGMVDRMVGDAVGADHVEPVSDGRRRY